MRSVGPIRTTDIRIHIYSQKKCEKVDQYLKKNVAENCSLPPAPVNNKLDKKQCNSSPYMDAKYSLLPLGSGFMDFSPGFHPAGHTSSGFS